MTKGGSVVFVPNGKKDDVCSCDFRPVPLDISYNRSDEGGIVVTPALLAHNNFLLCCYKCNVCLNNSSAEAKRIIFGGK